MYIGDKQVDQTILSYRAMHDQTLREAYVQGAIQDMLEKLGGPDQRIPARATVLHQKQDVRPIKPMNLAL